MDFDVLVNLPFKKVTTDKALSPIEKKNVLSITNDFENGEWRYDKFQKFIWNNIKETALSVRERNSLISEGEDSILTESAKNLRLVETPGAIGRGSEIGEIVLYGIMKHHYSALPVVPKIFYKQNLNDEAKGADSVHIVIEGDDEFSLWFGESKFYNSIEDARLDVIIKSVKESISLEKIKKENSIITNVGDLDEFDGVSDELRERIKQSLSQSESVDNIKPILNIPILLLYECTLTQRSSTLSDQYKDDLINYHKDRATKYFSKQIAKCQDVHLYDQIRFHIILFPVPEKEKIVDKFIQKAKVFRD